MATPFNVKGQQGSIPSLGLGTATLFNNICKTTVFEAIKLGYRHIDTALLYDNQEAVGAGIAEAISAGFCTREDLFVTTQVGFYPAAADGATPLLAASQGGHDEVAERMVGTALVLAFMANAKTLKVTELARRVAAASAHFRGVTVQGIDHDWDWLYSCYLLMLSPGNLSSRSGWLEKSRLWRFLMMCKGN